MQTPAEAEAPNAAPTPGPRALRNAAIAGFLLFQIAMPLRYYLGGRGSDERFSWRMFSSVRMQKCDVRVDETADGQRRRVDLERALQIAWVGMLERDRPAVVEKVLARRCREHDVSAVRYRQTCQNTDGSSSPPLELERACKSGVLAPPKAAP